MSAEKARDVAQYMCQYYKEIFGNPLDELKLHQFLYLAQKRSVVNGNGLLFLEEMYGWKFGPVCKNVRKAYKNGQVKTGNSDRLSTEHIELIKNIVSEFGGISSWKLSDMVGEDFAYVNSRKGKRKGVAGDDLIDVNDFTKTA